VQHNNAQQAVCIGAAARSESVELSGLLRELLGLGLLQLSDGCLRLGAHHTTAPVATNVVSALVEVGLDRLDELGQSRLVLRVDEGEREAGRGLAVHHSAETRLVLDDTVGHTHLTAQRR